jgi:hypothetical protein
MCTMIIRNLGEPISIVSRRKVETTSTPWSSSSNRNETKRRKRHIRTENHEDGVHWQEMRVVGSPQSV